VKRPIDLGRIRRLVDDEYQSIAAWNREMNLIWGNAEKFNGLELVLTSLALEIRWTFEKESKKQKSLSIQKWAKIVGELKDCLNDLLDSPPEVVSSFATISEKTDPNPLRPFTDEEKDQFIPRRRGCRADKTAKRCCTSSTTTSRTSQGRLMTSRSISASSRCRLSTR
jgi:hypothetical protein